MALGRGACLQRSKVSGVLLLLLLLEAMELDAALMRQTETLPLLPPWGTMPSRIFVYHSAKQGFSGEDGSNPGVIGGSSGAIGGSSGVSGGYWKTIVGISSKARSRHL